MLIVPIIKPMKIKFCGGARTVTGSSYLITLDSGYKILLDCGLYQGHAKELENFNREWPFDPKDIDCLILSHAHIDHAGRIPKLVKDGFRGRIISTHATAGLSSIMLMDSAKIQKSDAKYKSKKGLATHLPLYLPKHVPKALQKFIGIGYDQWFKIKSGVKVLLRDAGHILGSANVTLRIKEKGKPVVMIGFTGDIGRPGRPILRDPVIMPQVDYLICESTYGNREHASTPNETSKFLNTILKTCVDNKGKLLIPAFSVGRTQEILYMLDQLESSGQLPRIPVFVDSPLAINATKIFSAHPECFDKEMSNYLLTDDNPFGFNDLYYINKRERSMKLNDAKGPCIIIGASGMINAGRIKHHVYHHGRYANNTILLVGYCSPGTPGGKLRRGKRRLSLFGEIVPIKAQVVTMDSFSAHADRVEMAGFLRNQKNLKNLFLVHGEYDTQQEFKEYLGKFGLNRVEIPTLRQEFKIR